MFSFRILYNMPGHVPLKLVCTLLNYRVLGTSTATVFLSNDHSLYAPIYLGWTSCLISFAWDQLTCQERVGSDNRTQQSGPCPNLFREEKALILVPSDCYSGIPQPLDLSSLTVWPEHSLLWRMSMNIFDILFLSPKKFVF